MEQIQPLRTTDADAVVSKVNELVEKMNTVLDNLTVQEDLKDLHLQRVDIYRSQVQDVAEQLNSVVDYLRKEY